MINNDWAEKQVMGIFDSVEMRGVPASADFIKDYIDFVTIEPEWFKKSDIERKRIVNDAILKLIEKGILKSKTGKRVLRVADDENYESKAYKRTEFFSRK